MRSSNVGLLPRDLFERIFRGCVYAMIIIVNLFPFVWGFVTSIKETADINVYPPMLSGFDVSWTHYETILNSNFPIALRNSIFYSLSAILISAVCSIMFAYAFTRHRFRTKKLFFYLILFGIPLSMGSAALVVPNYLLFSKVGMVNRWYTLPLLYVSYNLPMACWVMVGGMASVPSAIDEAASIDGANKRYIIFVLIPRLCLPCLACSALLTFIGAWNEYVVSSVLVSSQGLYPIQVSIYTYLGYFGREWGPLMASALMAVVPILIVFTFLGKLLISGLTSGAVKE